MKKISLIIVLLSVFNLGFGQSDIIISQYIETSFGSTPKGIEIFNISGADITFTAANNLQISKGVNGGACSLLTGTNITSGTLRANEVWVLGSTNLTAFSNSNGINLSGTTDYGFSFNGDDALELYLGGVLQDAFGTCGNDPGTAWSGGGVTTRNNNLQIQDGLCSGNTAGWTDPSTRFDQISDGLIMTGFGNAPAICCLTTAIWTSGAWSPATGPTINTPIIIDDDYITNVVDGSFSACSLTVTSGNTLTINDGYYVEVENDITINGDIQIEPQGSIVQNNNIAIATGNAKVVKETAPMDAWYEYTYWSSPVSGETISGAIDQSDPSRRYLFFGQNFLDATAETNNNDATIAGQDDIDDNGDDWQPAVGVMQPGIGYATTVTDFAYSVAPGTTGKQFRFTFEGPFNNGVYNVPIYRNDSELNDNNWNLIGNPYPSAIDVDLFLAGNTVIDETNTFPPRSIVGAIYLWSHNTPPSAIANGNQGRNFSDSDYAIINGVTQIAGGDGVSPTNRKIPSGQAFFVSYSDAAIPDSAVGDIKEGTVVFNNSMRTIGTADNSLFFKNSNTKKSSNTLANKLWVNLTSDNGVFNQIAVAYVNGATDANDGTFYDAKKNAGTVTGALLYSNIEGSNNKFGIQSKAVNSLDMDETISLGFKSNIGVATLFKLSIDHLEGDFLADNTIYLKDNMLNKLHDLSSSNYTFVTEVGEFNSRFEIVFNASALSTDEVDLNTNKFSIVDLDNDRVQFNTNSSLNIKTVSVFDLLGRQLYDLTGSNSSETYTLSNLNNAVYIAKIELSNGMVITKKAIKK